MPLSLYAVAFITKSSYLPFGKHCSRLRLPLCPVESVTINLDLADPSLEKFRIRDAIPENPTNIPPVLSVPASVCVGFDLISIHVNAGHVRGVTSDAEQMVFVWC